jgi:hypothetical protein
VKEKQNGEIPYYTKSVFGEDLRWLLWHGPALALMAEQEGTWLSGQCNTLAIGILRYIQFSKTLLPSAVDLAIVGDTRCLAHHVVVCIEQKWYLDANGVGTKDELLQYWQDEEGLKEPYLAPYDEQLLSDMDIPHDGRMSTRLADCLFNMFGRFSPAFLPDYPESLRKVS